MRSIKWHYFSDLVSPLTTQNHPFTHIVSLFILLRYRGILHMLSSCVLLSVCHKSEFY